jgi:L-lactate dehydrogenase
MKIGIIGSGFVGATTAYALVMRGVGREIVLVDLNKSRAQAEADDILHAVPFAHPLNVYAGDYEDLVDSKVVIITAGVSQKPGETRLELLARNTKVFKTIIPDVLRFAPDTVLVVTTNPVDIMTHLTAQIAANYGVASNRVLGSGTTLDTARFRTLLGRHLGVDSHHVHAYVVGEHGDSEVLTWSMATVGGTPLEDFCQRHGMVLHKDIHADIDHQVRHAAYHIIEGKGATYYGIGSALARIVDVILKDQRAILTVCHPIEEIVGVKDVTVSLPFLVGGEGVLDRFPLPLNEDEIAKLQTSALVVRAAIDTLEAMNAN